MQAAPTPHNEQIRLARLRGLGLLDTPPEAAFDNLAVLAQSLCDTPIALITLVDEHRQWIKARCGAFATETPRDVSFCTHAILQPGAVMVVADAQQDPRFVDNPLVAGAPHVRFYAGAPIVTDDGLALGTLCVLDLKPRYLTRRQSEALGRLAALVGQLIARAQERMRSSQVINEQLLAMVTAGLDLLAFVDTDRLFRQANQRFLDYHGCSREDVIGRTVPEMIGVEAYETLVKDKLDRALNGEVVFYERQGKFKGCGTRHLAVALLPLRGADSTVNGVVMRAHDIEEAKQREARLSEAVKQLEAKTLEQQRFIQIISHDLREPINSINNFSQLIEEMHRPLLPNDGQRFLDFVRKGGLRMRDLLDDLLHYVHLDNHELVTTPIDLNPVLAAVVADLDAAIQRRQALVEIEPMLTVHADPTLLRLAIQNLVANALKFVAEGVQPQVRVSATTSADEHIIDIQDNGIGIAPEHQQSIFGVFTRLHTRRQFDGSGLGLSICRRITDLHGGKLMVQSTPGEGSLFSIHLPLRTHLQRNDE